VKPEIFRDRPRFLFHRPGLWRLPDGSLHPGEILDLSLTGARLRTPTLPASAPKEGEALLPLIPELPLVCLPSRVVWRTASLLGLEFHSLDVRVRKVLQSFVEFHLDSGLTSMK